MSKQPAHWELGGNQNLPRRQDDFAFSMNDVYSPSMLELDAVSLEIVFASTTATWLEDDFSCRSVGEYIEIWAIWLVTEVTLWDR